MDGRSRCRCRSRMFGLEAGWPHRQTRIANIIRNRLKILNSRGKNLPKQGKKINTGKYILSAGC